MEQVKLQNSLENFRSDMQDKLEDLYADLTIIYETVNVLEIFLSENGISAEQISRVLAGITRNMDKSVKDTEKMVEYSYGRGETGIR